MARDPLSKEAWTEYLASVRAGLEEEASEGEITTVSAAIQVSCDPETGEDIGRGLIVAIADFEGDAEELSRQKRRYTTSVKAVALAGAAEALVVCMEVYASAQAAQRGGTLRPSHAADRKSVLTVSSEHAVHGCEIALSVIDEGPPRRFEKWRIIPYTAGTMGGTFQNLLPPEGARIPKAIAIARELCRRMGISDRLVNLD